MLLSQMSCKGSLVLFVYSRLTIEYRAPAAVTNALRASQYSSEQCFEQPNVLILLEDTVNPLLDDLLELLPEPGHFSFKEP